MLNRVFCVLLFSYLSGVFFAPFQVSKKMEKPVMTEDQALSALRSRVTSNSALRFVTVRAVEPTAITRHAAEESLDEVRAKHLILYGDGILLNLMRAGGFVVLEFDADSDRATRLHLVSMDVAGKAVVQSKDVDGDVSRGDALTLISSTEKLSDAFFNAPSSRYNELLLKFEGTRVANAGISDGQGYFAIPEHVVKLTTQPDELLNLRSL